MNIRKSRQPLLLAALAVALLLPLGCGTTNDLTGMSVTDALARYPSGTTEMITVSGRVIQSLDDRSFAMGEGNNVLLIVSPADRAPLSTVADAGDRAVVTGTMQWFREGDPTLTRVTPAVRAALLNQPGILASNVQVIDQ